MWNNKKDIFFFEGRLLLGLVSAFSHSFCLPAYPSQTGDSPLALISLEACSPLPKSIGLNQKARKTGIYFLFFWFLSPPVNSSFRPIFSMAASGESHWFPLPEPPLSKIQTLPIVPVAERFAASSVLSGEAIPQLFSSRQNHILK